MALLVNVTVGAGIFRLPADVQQLVGNYSLAAFVVCALIIGLIALCFAEVGSRFSGTGGPYLYARETFGPTLAFLVGWLMWLTRLAGFATLVQVFVAYLGFFWPPVESGLPRIAVITGLVVVLTVTNLIGVKQSARASDILTVSKLIPLALFVGAGLFFITPSHFTFSQSPTVASFSAAVFILIYAFSGFEAVLVNSGEIRQPRRVIPFALMIALTASVALFLLIQLVCIGTLPQLASSQRPLADASRRFLGVIGPTIISAGALVGILGTLNVITLACTRLPFAMAAHGQLPLFLARVHPRFRTPHVSILVCAVLVLLLSLTGTFIYAVKVTVITRVIVYAGTCLALPILRRRKRNSLGATSPSKESDSFAVPGGTLISIVSLVLCLGLLANSGWREARDVGIAMAIGLVVYLGMRLRKSLDTSFS